MQGKKESLLSSTDKVKSLSEMIKTCGRFEMFSIFWKEEGRVELMCPIISLLEQLQGKIQEYFLSINLDKYQWVQNPFVLSDKLDTTILSCQEEDDLTDIRNDGGLKNSFQ